MDWSRKHVVVPKPEFGLKQQPHRKRKREKKMLGRRGVNWAGQHLKHVPFSSITDETDGLILVQGVKASK